MAPFPASLGSELDSSGSSIRYSYNYILSRGYVIVSVISLIALPGVGRLYQVEYAIEAISQAGAAVGILSKEGVVIAAEKRSVSKLLDVRKATEKLYKIDDHIACAVAGITADANILINYARLEAQRFGFQYQEPVPIEQLLRTVCDLKQGYTQYGGMRPFGVSFLFAGWDEQYGFQLYMSDPSGNYGGWKARAIGSNNGAAQTILKNEFKEELTLQEAMILAVKVLSKTMDTTAPTPDKLEFATVTRDAEGKVHFTILGKPDLERLIAESAEALQGMAKEAAEEGTGDS